MNINSLHDLNKLFSWALIWSSIESFLYYCILTTHTFLLFSYASAELYGLQGALFASLYLCITLINGAFDIALIPVFVKLQNTSQGRRYLIRNLIIQGLILFTLPLVAGLMIYYHFYYDIPTWASSLLNPQSIMFASALIATEGTKRNLRAILHFLLYYKALTFLELSNIVIYLSVAWGLIYAHQTITLTVLLVPFFMVSVITTAVLALLLIRHHKKHAPTVKNDFNDAQTHKDFLKTRMWSYLNQMSRTLFSGNFLLPFFSLKVGIAHVGLATLINSLTYVSTSIIQKILGAVAATLLAHTHQHPRKQEVVGWLINTGNILSLMFLFLCIITAPHFFSISVYALSTNALGLTLLFFGVHIMESTFVIYEKLLIAQHKAHFLFYLNSAHGAICLGASYFWNKNSLSLLLIFYLLSRLVFLTIFKKLYDRSSTKKDAQKKFPLI